MKGARRANDRLSYCPVPLSAMLSGEPGALEVIVTAAFIGPVAVGAKCPWIVQLDPAARLAPQLLAKMNDDASAPVTAMLVIVSVPLPVLVMVTVCEPLAVPTVVGAYDKLVAEKVIAGVTPVPLSAMVCGEVVSLSVMVMLAPIGPVPVGAKCP